MASKWTAIVSLLALVAMASAPIADSFLVPEAVASIFEAAPTQMSCHRNMTQAAIVNDPELSDSEAKAYLKALGCRLMSDYARDHFTAKEVVKFVENCPRLDQLDPREIQQRLNEYVAERVDLDLIKLVMRANSTEGIEARERANEHEIIKQIKPCVGHGKPQGSGEITSDKCARLTEIAESHFTERQVARFSANCAKIVLNWDELLTFTAETGARSVIKLAIELEPIAKLETGEAEPWMAFYRLVGLHRLERV